jgi:retron-type reverse transcriptase
LSIKKIKSSYCLYVETLKERIEECNYDFEISPKTLLIKDPSERERRVFVYNVLERWMQQYLKLRIEPAIESILSDCVFAYRRGRSATDCHEYILRSNSKYVLKIDIKDYFASINRDYLWELIDGFVADRGVFTLIKNSFLHHHRGLPAGHVLSCMLSNVYLMDFDKVFPYGYARYSDDMMFAFNTRKEIEGSLSLIESLLSERDLVLNSEKTRIIIDPTLEEIG